MSINTETIFDQIDQKGRALNVYVRAEGGTVNDRLLVDLCTAVGLLRAKIMQMDKESKEGKE